MSTDLKYVHNDYNRRFIENWNLDRNNSGFFSQNNQEWRRNVNVDILKWKKIDEKWIIIHVFRLFEKAYKTEKQGNALKWHCDEFGFAACQWT